MLVIADVHGRPAILTNAFLLADRERCDETWFLGDAFGRGPEGMRCWQMLQERGALTLRGNHDQALVDNQPLDPLLEGEIRKIRSDGRFAEIRTQVSARPSSLRRSLGGVEALLVHGSPVDELWEPIDSDGSLEAARAGARGARLILAGHSHLPLFAVVSDDGVEDFRVGPVDLAEGADLSEALEAGHTVVLNPGALAPPYTSCGVLRLGSAGAPRSFEWFFAPRRKRLFS